MTESTPSLYDGTVLRAADDVLRRTAGAESVLLDLASEEFYGLEGVGARLFELVEQPRSLDSVMDVLLAEYDVEREVLTSDVHALIVELLARRLVLIVS